MYIYIHVYIHTFTISIDILRLSCDFPTILQFFTGIHFCVAFVQWPVSIRHHHRIIRRQMPHERSQIFLKRRTTGRAKKKAKPIPGT